MMPGCPLRRGPILPFGCQDKGLADPQVAQLQVLEDRRGQRCTDWPDPGEPLGLDLRVWDQGPDWTSKDALTWGPLLILHPSEDQGRGKLAAQVVPRSPDSGSGDAWPSWEVAAEGVKRLQRRACCKGHTAWGRDPGPWSMGGPSGHRRHGCLSGAGWERTSITGRSGRSAGASPAGQGRGQGKETREAGSQV